MRRQDLPIVLAAALLPAWSAFAQTTTVPPTPAQPTIAEQTTTPPTTAQQTTIQPRTIQPPDTTHETELIVPGDKSGQRIERIQINEPAAKIDETRYGGQTQSITVQPAGGLPQYNVAPANSVPQDLRTPEQRGGSPGPRTWKILGF